MRFFLHDILFTSLIFVVILIVADVLMPPPINNYAIKQYYIIEHHNDIKTLVMGNSLAEYSFNTHVLGDSAYCFAISRRALYYDAKLMDRYIPIMQNLRTVILTCNYRIDAYPRFDSTNIVWAKNFIYNYYRSFSVTIDSFPYGVLFRSAVFSDNFNIHALRPTFAIADEVGYVEHDWIFDGQVKEIVPLVQDNMDKGLEYLSNIASLCYQYGVRLIVVTPPFSDAWLELCTSDGVKNLTNIIERVNSQYPIEYKNYMYDSCFRNDSMYFDCLHLNHTGATIFAQRVKDDFTL
jgi:hypothetical protein